MVGAVTPCYMWASARCGNQSQPNERIRECRRVGTGRVALERCCRAVPSTPERLSEPGSHNSQALQPVYTSRSGTWPCDAGPGPRSNPAVPHSSNARSDPLAMSSSDDEEVQLDCLGYFQDNIVGVWRALSLACISLIPQSHLSSCFNMTCASSAARRHTVLPRRGQQEW